MPGLEADEAVSVRCEDCREEFYVTEEPQICPHCGSEDIGTGYNVIVRPH